MDGIIKVDRAASAEEAAALQAAGATVVGVSLAPDPRYADGRTVSAAVAQQVRASLTAARLCVTLDPDAADPAAAIAAACAARPDYLQVPRYGAARFGWREAILAAGVPVVLDGEAASYEDEPGWVASTLDDALSWGPSLIQLDLLDDMDDPWQFLTERAPRDLDGLLQASEIAGLAARFPLLVGMRLLPGQAVPFRAAFPAARGVFLRLDGDDAAAVTALVSALRDAAGAPPSPGAHLPA